MLEPHRDRSCSTSPMHRGRRRAPSPSYEQTVITTSCSGARDRGRGRRHARPRPALAGASNSVAECRRRREPGICLAVRWRARAQPPEITACSSAAERLACHRSATTVVLLEREILPQILDESELEPASASASSPEASSAIGSRRLHKRPRAARDDRERLRPRVAHEEGRTPFPSRLLKRVDARDRRREEGSALDKASSSAERSRADAHLGLRTSSICRSIEAIGCRGLYRRRTMANSSLSYERQLEAGKGKVRPYVKIAVNRATEHVGRRAGVRRARGALENDAQHEERFRELETLLKQGKAIASGGAAEMLEPVYQKKASFPSPWCLQARLEASQDPRAAPAAEAAGQPAGEQTRIPGRPETNANSCTRQSPKRRPGRLERLAKRWSRGAARTRSRERARRDLRGGDATATSHDARRLLREARQHLVRSRTFTRTIVRARGRELFKAIDALSSRMDGRGARRAVRAAFGPPLRSRAA